MDDADCVGLGIAYAEACDILRRGVDGRQIEELSQSLLAAIGQLTV